MNKKAILTPCLTLVAVVCAMTCLATSGCNGKKETEENKKAKSLAPASSELIALIDLNRVATEIGAKAIMDIELKKSEDALVAQLNGLKSELGLDNDNLNSEQPSLTSELVLKNSATLNLKAKAAQTQLAMDQADLKRQFLKQVRPVAYQVAKERGMQIVMTVGQVYAAGPNANITDEVIKRFKQAQQAAEANAQSERPEATVATLPGGGDFMPR